MKVEYNIYRLKTDETIQSIQYIEKELVQTGYEIKTSDQTMLFLIDNHSNCCKDWGVISDDIDSVIGTKLNKVQYKNEEAHMRINVVYDMDRLFEIDMWCEQKDYHHPLNYYIKHRY